MKYCSNCGAELNENAVICVKCGAAVQQAAEDKVSVGLVILSIFIPLFGIIYWAVKAKETPKRAKACGIAALITIGVVVLLYIILIVGVIGLAANM